MKNYTLIIVLLSSVISVSTAYAADNCIATVQMSKLHETIGRHSDFYGDLPSRVNCNKPVENQKIICENDALRFMEKLDHMGGVYAYENGTRTELNHKKPYDVSGLNKMLNKCSTAECVCTKFKERANSAFGGTSPYVAD